ncbi:uncharacterized protein LOC125037519 [Penaeus chinensis]|uniref:uncharacterized protein LOC125037519 n=1 Tax=Penaeus chinensis TaxID=139456 RepID=UPI001FB857B2|nr:uncharacterized protein LOC125037519 [Penaeus chinensis]
MEVTDSCPVCLESWDKTAHTPKFLSCHHTLCLGCATTLFKNAVAEEGGGLGEEGDWQGRRGRGRGGFVQRMRGGSPSEEVPSPWSPTSIPRRFMQSRAPVSHRDSIVSIPCPMCRSSTLVRDPNSLQTNFYLGSLRRTPSVPRLLLWCETCDAIAEPACGAHSVHPLPDRVKSLKDELTSTSIIFLEDMYSVLAEQHRHLRMYKWLCALLNSAKDQVKQTFVKNNDNYNITRERIQILQQMLDECEAVCAKVEDEEKVTELLRLQMTLRAYDSSWYGGDQRGEEEREGKEETGGEKKRRRISLPVIQNLFYIHSDIQPPDNFQNAHVILESSVNGATLSVVTKYEIEKEEESGEEEKSGQTEVDGLRRSSGQQNHKKRDDNSSLSFSVTDIAHRRLRPSRSLSTPAGMCGTLPVFPKAPSGSHRGAQTVNLGTNTMPSSRRGGLSTETLNTVGVPVPAPRAPLPVPSSIVASQGRYPELVLRDPQLASSIGEETRPSREEQESLFPDALWREASCTQAPPLPPRASELNAVSFLESRGEPSFQHGDEAPSNISEFLEESPYPAHMEPQARPHRRRRRPSRRPEEQNRGRRRRGNACVIV